VEKEGLPREQPVLHLLLRMLALGLSAWEMIETQDFRDGLVVLPKFRPHKINWVKKTTMGEKGAELLLLKFYRFFFKSYY
jgi:hypothetical protein